MLLLPVFVWYLVFVGYRLRYSPVTHIGDNFQISPSKCIEGDKLGRVRSHTSLLQFLNSHLSILLLIAKVFLTHFDGEKFDLTSFGDVHKNRK